MLDSINDFLAPADLLLDSINDFLAPADLLLDSINNFLAPAELLLDSRNDFLAPAELFLDSRNDFLAPADLFLDSRNCFFSLADSFLESSNRRAGFFVLGVRGELCVRQLRPYCFVRNAIQGLDATQSPERQEILFPFLYALPLSLGFRPAVRFWCPEPFRYCSGPGAMRGKKVTPAAVRFCWAKGEASPLMAMPTDVGVLPPNLAALSWETKLAAFCVHAA